MEWHDYDDGPVISGRAIIEWVLIGGLVIAIVLSIWFTFSPVRTH